MKKALLALAVSATFISCGAHATGSHDDWTNPFDHATRTELNGAVKTLNAADAKETAARIEGDKNLQGQINGANGSIKAVDDKLNGAIGAGQAAYNQLQGQVGQLNDKIDQTRADGAAAIGQTNQAVKAVDGKVNDLAKAGAAAYQHLDGKINGAVATQTGVNVQQHDNNVQQQNQINAVQGAAQTANDRATNLEGRADKVEGAVRETNAQLAVTDARSINNSVRLDGVESGVAGNTAAIKATNSVVASQGATISRHTAQISNLDQRTTVNTTNIAKNTSDIKATNTAVANHETRITGTEKVNARQDVTLNEHTAALQQNASQWQTQGQINNEYGQRLDAQDAMSSRFAGDLGNLKSQVAGMNDRINSADRKAEKALNAAAGALSVASIQFNTDVEAGFQVGAGVATLAGKNAAAVGVGGALNKNWFVSGYATQAGSASGGAVSATYSFGR